MPKTPKTPADPFALAPFSTLERTILDDRIKATAHMAGLVELSPGVWGRPRNAQVIALADRRTQPVRQPARKAA